MTDPHFRIGDVQLNGVAVFAPLAGISDLPMRLLAKQEGCALVCSEMISANGLVYGSAKTVSMLASSPLEKPLSVQIFGSDPAIMAEAAARVEASGADILDINFGCAVKKILKSGAGAALMKRPREAAVMLQAVRDSVHIPLTVKLRSGWHPSGRDALRMTAVAQACGVDAVTLHPRTAQQGFAGQADWRIIAMLKAAADIPVIGNGDIITARDALDMMRQTRCDAVMIGRGAIGNPCIFSQIAALAAGGQLPPFHPTRQFELLKRYLRESILIYGETNACRMMRSRLGWFVKGMANSSRFREAIKHIRTESEAVAVIEAYQKQLNL